MHAPPLIRHKLQAITLLLLTLLAGCVTRGYPTHGGGKRFFQEQALVTGAIDSALDQINFEPLGEMITRDAGTKAKSIGVHVFSVAHSGGGISNGGNGVFGSALGGLFGGSFGGGSAKRNHSNAFSAPLAPALNGVKGDGYLSYAFGSADDIRYVMGRLIGKLGQEGLSVQTAEKQSADKPTLCILIRQLGIDQSDFSALVYSEKLLRARSSIEAFVVHQTENEDKEKVTTVTPLGEGTGTMRFREDFFFGIGPLSGGVVEVDTTEDGQ